MSIEEAKEPKETKETKETKFNNIVFDFYKLKKQYDSSLEKEILKITKLTSLTKTEKHEKFKQLKRKCINCGREGGTIFNTNSILLSAKCGNIEKPCKLNIQIQKSKYINISDRINELDNIINDNKRATILTKLDSLFGFTSETSALEEFNKLKIELIQEVKKYQQINELYLNLILNLPKKEEITQRKNDLLVIIGNFKELIDNFNESGNIAYIKEAVELYLSTIESTAKVIRDLKYTYNSIEYNENDNTYHLIQEQYTRSQLQIPIKSAENRVISYKR